MNSDSTLSIIVKLQDEASEKLATLASKVTSVGETVGNAASKLGDKISSIGTSMENAGKKMTGAGTAMSIGLTAPIVALGTAIIDTSMKFESSMELIRTQAGASQQEVDNMTKSVLALSKSGETAQGPQALADGLYHLESLGLRGSAAMDALKVSAQGADLGLADMEGVTNALGAAIVTGIKGTQNMQQAMGLLDATIGQGNMRMDDLVAALGTGILPAAKNFGLSLQDVGAALATLTDNGMGADESATRLRMTFSLLAAPTQKATDALATIGLTSRTLADDMRNGGIVQAIDDLNAHLNAVQPTQTSFVKSTVMTATQMSDLKTKIYNAQQSLKILTEETVKSGPAVDRHNLALDKARQTIAAYQAQLSGANTVLSTTGGKMLDATEKAQLLSEAFGGGRSSAAILTLTQQADRLKNKYDAIGASADTFNEKVQATHETNQYKLNAALAQMQTLLIDLGGTLMPLFATALGKVTKIMEVLVGWWDTLSPKTQTFIAITLAAVAALGPLLIILGSIVTAIGVIVTALGSLISFFGITTTMMATFGVAAAPMLLVLAAVATAVLLVVDAFNKMQSAAQGAIDAGQGAQASAASLDPLIANATGAQKAKLQAIQASSSQTGKTAQAIGDRYQGFGGLANSITDFLHITKAPSFEVGGTVPGNRGQAIPIIAHGGETIVPAGQSGGRGGVVNLHFNFNGATAGDDGIKRIIKQAVNELNRTTTLRQFAGA